MKTDAGAKLGMVTRVSGPLVQIEHIDDLSMREIVLLGPSRISSETVAINETHATLQAYEYTGGLRAGDVAEATGTQLTGLLGPGLLGHVFDGLMRPLTSAPMWLTQDRATSVEDPESLARPWSFLPAAALGSTVAPGDLLGTVPDAGSVEHRVVVPSGVSGTVDWLRPPGPTRASDVVARVGSSDVLLTERWPIRAPRPFRARITGSVPLHTGQRVLDLLFPIARGSAAAVPGGFGTGKTMLLQQIAKWSDADVIVYVGCGERGNEMADVLEGLGSLVDARTGGKLIDRTVIIANTSNMPMMAREASIHTGMSVAEYYRDMGYDVVVIADSTSRWAEACGNSPTAMVSCRPRKATRQILPPNSLRSTSARHESPPSAVERPRSPSSGPSRHPAAI
nr:hypothetical protein [Cryobacterium sp. MLB-32]